VLRELGHSPISAFWINMPMTGHDPRQQSLKTPPRAASPPQMQRAGCVAQRTLCGRPPVCQFTRKVSSIEEGRLWDRATTFGLLRTGPQYPFLICRYRSKSSDHDRPDTTLLYLSATRERLALRCKFRVALNEHSHLVLFVSGNRQADNNCLPVMF
jgi:hypothetical protein